MMNPHSRYMYKLYETLLRELFHFIIINGSRMKAFGCMVRVGIRLLLFRYNTATELHPNYVTTPYNWIVFIVVYLGSDIVVGI